MERLLLCSRLRNSQLRYFNGPQEIRTQNEPARCNRKQLQKNDIFKATEKWEEQNERMN